MHAQTKAEGKFKPALSASYAPPKHPIKPREQESCPHLLTVLPTGRSLFIVFWFFLLLTSCSPSWFVLFLHISVNVLSSGHFKHILYGSGN